MANYVRNRKASAALESLARDLPASVAAAPAIERAAALAVANALLVAGSRAWGRAVLDAPARMSQDDAVDAVCHLADDHARLEAVAPTLEGRPEADPLAAALRWETMANEVVTLTLGAAIDPAAFPAATRCWKSLWSARREAPAAVKAMMFYAKSYGVSPIPLPEGRAVPSPIERLAPTVEKLSGTLPPMFRPKAPVK